MTTEQDNVKEFRPEAAKQITQSQLALCEVALNVAAMQFDVSAQLCLANKSPTLANEMASAAVAMRQTAKLISTGAIKGMQIIRANSNG